LFIRLNISSAIQSNGFSLHAIVGLLLHHLSALLSVTQKKAMSQNQTNYLTARLLSQSQTVVKTKAKVTGCLLSSFN